MQPKISFFTWEVVWEKILTIDQLQRRGIHLANRGYLCLQYEKLVDHLLLHCLKTHLLWELLFSLFGTTWVMLGSVMDSLLCWRGSFEGEKGKKVWQAAPSYLLWAVWKAWNHIVFVHIETKNCVSFLALVGDQVVYRKWSFDLSWFH